MFSLLSGCQMLIGFQELEGLRRESDSQKKPLLLFYTQHDGFGAANPLWIQAGAWRCWFGSCFLHAQVGDLGCMLVRIIGRTCRGLAESSAHSHVARFAARLHD